MCLVADNPSRPLNARAGRGLEILWQKTVSAPLSTPL